MLVPMDERTLGRLFAVLLLLAGLQLLVHANFLAALVANRFDMAGDPRGWIERDVWVVRKAARLAAMPFLFLLLPRLLVRYWPERLIWRGRTYRFAAERRAAFAGTLARLMLWLGLGSVALGVLSTQLVFDANLRTPPHLDVKNLSRLMAAYMAFVIVWIWRAWRAFPRKRARGDAAQGK
jgi:hypothetical protein